MSDYQDLYGDDIQRNESPFKTFIGRNSETGDWWMVHDQERYTVTKFTGVVVDGALFRITGKNQHGTVKAKSNLCSPVQTTLRIVETENGNDSIIATTNKWKDWKERTVGQHTKVVAMIVLKATLSDGTTMNLDSLAEVRLRGTQVWLYNEWLKEEGKKDHLISCMFWAPDGNLNKNEKGWIHSKFRIGEMTEDQQAKYGPIVKKHFLEIKEYVLNSSPVEPPPIAPSENIITNPDAEGENPLSQESTHPMQTQPVSDSEFPEASDEPPVTGEEDDSDMPF